MNDHLLDDFVEGASPFQMRQFNVAQTGVTEWGKYVQAMRELKTRRDVLDSLGLQQIALDLQIAKECHWLRRLRRRFTFFGQREHLLRMAGLRMEATDLDDRKVYTQREEREFRSITAILKESIGEITPERREQLDVDKWVHDVARRASLEMAYGKTLSHGTAEIIHSATAEWRDRALATMELHDWRLRKYDREVSCDGYLCC